MRFHWLSSRWRKTASRGCMFLFCFVWRQTKLVQVSKQVASHLNNSAQGAQMWSACMFSLVAIWTGAQGVCRPNTVQVAIKILGFPNPRQVSRAVDNCHECGSEMGWLTVKARARANGLYVGVCRQCTCKDKIGAQSRAVLQLQAYALQTDK